MHDNPDLDPAQREEFLSIIIKESERLTRLINQVLDLARIEAGRFDWQMGRVNVRDLLSEALAATRQLFKDRNVALTSTLPRELPVVLADRDQLMQVVINLLSNAVKFSPSGTGAVAIAAVARPDGVEIRVSDNGPGIAPEHQLFIFEKFRQVGDTLTGKPQGSGLGLAICRRIIEHFGGRIWVESEPGQGATFAVFVPHAAEQPLAAAS
jgi:signal transduction histidine kinase